MIAFNQNLFDEIDNKLELVRIGLGSKIKELSQALPGREDNFSDIIQRYIENPKSLTKPQKVALYLALIKKVQVGRQIMNKPEVGVKEPLKNIVKNPYKKDLYGNIQYNEFGLLYHEMGHMMHYKELSSVGLISKRLANISHFKKEVKQMTIPSYSKTSQLEFVAETIAGMLNGDVYSQQIMDLFNKLTNVRIPEK